MTTKASLDKPLTRRQQELYDFIADFIDEQGYGPTIREIGDHFMITSVSTVHGVVNKLVSKGYLTRTPNGPRTLALTNKGRTPKSISRASILAWIDQKGTEYAQDSVVGGLLTELHMEIEKGRVC